MGIDNFSKFKAEQNFNRRNILNILRIKIFLQRRNCGKLAFRNSLSKEFRPGSLYALIKFESDIIGYFELSLETA